ncbi:type II toxin-antitoxin system RelE/ParE family toxin [Pseudoflavitalea rhizosphaerae]|uniref:type II toxin-antitoxin system RelE/ParE family toxin n=1 Tax=Pseudoflavitalea rhizosphaerae TaxID=1884793 RepID=UPI000F8DE84E|nr:type II toxin-antitoxin system RelE/ParE family toxin [Pseudoflavitalea rhizosphaerae]
MNYSYKLHPLVQDDYNEAYEWYEDQQKGLGERFVKAVRARINEILINPEVYSSKGNRKFREAQVEFFPYLIVYKVSKKNKELLITSIHHMKKRPRKKYRK